MLICCLLYLIFLLIIEGGYALLYVEVIRLFPVFAVYKFAWRF